MDVDAGAPEVDIEVPEDAADLFTDLDGDGRVDVTAVDADGDGVLDLAWTDADGDGLVTADEVHPVADGGWSTDWYRHEENFRDGVLPAAVGVDVPDELGLAAVPAAGSQEAAGEGQCGHRARHASGPAELP